MMIMNEIFNPNKVNYILRTYLPYWHFQERIEEMVKFCKETGIKHVMLFSDAQHLCWNQLSLKEAHREVDNIRRAKKRLFQEGIRIGINSSYNMAQSRWDHRQHNDYDYWATLRNGMCEYRTPCLLDPKLETYLAKFYTMLAQVKPDYIYIDDDHRYINQGKDDTWGCFCGFHLQKFGELTSTNWTREKLDKVLKNVSTIRKLWIEFLGERLVQLARIIVDSIHGIDPEIEVGMMVPSVHPLPVMGHTITNVLEALKGIGKPLVRPCIGPYSDRDRRDIIPGLFYIEFIGHLLGDDVQYTPEIETTPFTRFSKSMTTVRFHIAQGILNRMNNPAISLCGYVGDSPYLEPEYVDLLKNNRDFFEGIRKIAPKRGTRKGIQFLWDFDSPKNATRKIAQASDLYWPSFVCHDMLGNMGFSNTYDESPVKFLAGESVAVFSKARIMDILKQGLLLDVHATKVLIDKGYGNLIGCEIEGNINGFGAEGCRDKDFCGSYVDTYIPLHGVRTDGVFKLLPKSTSRKISVITDHGRKEIAPGIVLFENELGGKIAVLPYSIQGIEPDLSHLICYHRQTMLRNIFNWMCPDVLGLSVVKPTDFAVQIWANGERIIACITNLSYDIVSKITIRIFTEKLKTDKAFYVTPKGDLESLKDAIEDISSGDFTQWSINQTFSIFTPFILVIEK